MSCKCHCIECGNFKQNKENLCLDCIELQKRILWANR